MLRRRAPKAPAPLAEAYLRLEQNRSDGIVLAAIRAAGHEPRIVEYLKTPPSRAELTIMLAAMGMTVRDILRRRGTPYEALSLDNRQLSDDALFAAIAAHPILIERPIVVSPKGTALCRPKEKVGALI